MGSKLLHRTGVTRKSLVPDPDPARRSLVLSTFLDHTKIRTAARGGVFPGGASRVLCSQSQMGLVNRSRVSVPIPPMAQLAGGLSLVTRRPQLVCELLPQHISLLIWGFFNLSLILSLGKPSSPSAACSRNTLDAARQFVFRAARCVCQHVCLLYLPSLINNPAPINE